MRRLIAVLACLCMTAVPSVADVVIYKYGLLPHTGASMILRTPSVWVGDASQASFCVTYTVETTGGTVNFNVECSIDGTNWSSLAASDGTNPLTATGNYIVARNIVCNGFGGSTTAYNAVPAPYIRIKVTTGSATDSLENVCIAVMNIDKN